MADVETTLLWRDLEKEFFIFDKKHDGAKPSDSLKWKIYQITQKTLNILHIVGFEGGVVGL